MSVSDASGVSAVPGVSAAPLGWHAFTERPVPADLGETVSPEAELAGVLQRRQEDLSAARGSGAESTARARETLFELASLVGRLDQLITRAEGQMADGGQKRLHRQLRVLKDQMLETLGGDGVEVSDPLGRPADEVADWVDPVGWRQGSQFTAEVVAQTDEPAVFHDGAVVRFARVIMGAPDPGEPATRPEPTRSQKARRTAGTTPETPPGRTPPQ